MIVSALLQTRLTKPESHLKIFSHAVDLIAEMDAMAVILKVLGHISSLRDLALVGFTVTKNTARPIACHPAATTLTDLTLLALEIAEHLPV